MFLSFSFQRYMRIWTEHLLCSHQHIRFLAMDTQQGQARTNSGRHRDSSSGGNPLPQYDTPSFCRDQLFHRRLFALLYYVLHYFTDSPIPAGDAFTTAVGIVATWMLARRIVEHWIFWIVVNCVSVYLYYLRGLYPTMFLYICYAILAAAGLYTWKKKGIRTNDSTL